MRKPLIVFSLVHWGALGALIYLALVPWQVPLEWVLFTLVLYLIFFVCVVVRILRHLYPFPIPSFLTRVIDNPVRRKFWQIPNLIAERMGLKPGMTVVEIGPGKGSYTKAAAKRILPDGKVYAVDISENVIQRLKEKFAREGVVNVVPAIENTYHFTFGDETIDRIYAVSCLPEIPDPVKVLTECRRILKPDGLVCLSELVLDPDYPLRRTEKKWAAKAGLELKQEFGTWVTYQLHFGKAVE